MSRYEFEPNSDFLRLAAQHKICDRIDRRRLVREGLDQGIWDNAEKAARTSEVLLVVGTSAVVYPAASLVPMAKRALA